MTRAVVLLGVLLASCAAARKAPTPIAVPATPPPPTEPAPGKQRSDDPTAVEVHDDVWIGVGFDATTTTIVQVVAGAPGALAGVLPGDEVISIDGAPMANATEVIKRVRGSKVGAGLAMIVARGNTQVTLPIVVARRPDPRTMVRQALSYKAAPDFTAPVLAGADSATLKALAGHVVIVDFWATWCGPCRITMPELAALHAKYHAKGLRIVGLSDEAPDAIRQFAADQKLPYTIAHDAGGEIAKRYVVPGVPMFVVIDKTGIVRRVELGAGLDGLDALVNRLL